MNPTKTQPQEPREQLRHRFLAHAAAAFDLMFLPEDPNHLLSFTQREQRAAELSRDLAAWLLQQQLENDPLACPSDATVIPCPRCARPACPQAVKDKPRLKRTLTTRVGAVSFQRQKWYCKICRISFFPSRRPAPAGCRGPQP
jgi:hypothetical protein